MVLDTRRKAAEKVSFRRGQQCSPKKISYIDDNNRGMINDKTYPVHISYLSTMYISNPAVSEREQKCSLFLCFKMFIFRADHSTKLLEILLLNEL